MTRRLGPDLDSDFVRVLAYLHTLMCPACHGIGVKSARGCKFCKETGFRDGDLHLLVSAKQVRRGR